MNEEKSATPVPTKSKRHVALVNIAGVLLIIGAAFLYWRDIKNNKEQDKAAKIVQMYASNPIMAMGLMLDGGGSASNAYMLCSVDITTNILAGLIKAEPTKFPRGLVEGDEYQIFMMYTNRAKAFLRAVRLYNDPENLYVGVRQPVKFDDDKQPTAWSYTSPALVIGLGTLFNALAETNVPLLRAGAPQIEAAMTNQFGTANQRAETPTTNDVPSVSDWMNSTNTPATE